MSGIPPEEGSSYRKAPRALQEVWLRFHESALCQGMDATFEFNESGMKVRSLIEDEKSYQKFQEMIQPLQSSFQIELDVSRPMKENKEGVSDQDENDPPPGIWQNYELRYNLGHSSMKLSEQNSLEMLQSDFEILKMRMYLYAVQTIELNKKMERYASDLPVLSRVSSDPAIEPNLRAKAKAISLMHSLELGKVISKLRTNLILAIPRTKQKEQTHAGKSSGNTKSVVDSSIQIADAAHAVAQRIFQFIYPERFTVGVEELRGSSFLDSLKALSRMNSDFQKEMSNPIKRK